MSLTQILEDHASYVLLFIIIAGYLFLKKVLTEKRFENRQYLFDDPYQVARLTIETYEKKNPEMLMSLSNVSKIKGMIDYLVAKMLAVGQTS
jgi:hypothetical protein